MMKQMKKIIFNVVNFISLLFTKIIPRFTHHWRYVLTVEWFRFLFSSYVCTCFFFYARTVKYVYSHHNDVLHSFHFISFIHCCYAQSSIDFLQMTTVYLFQLWLGIRVMSATLKMYIRYCCIFQRTLNTYLYTDVAFNFLFVYYFNKTNGRKSHFSCLYKWNMPLL